MAKTYDFLTDPAKLDAFRVWLSSQVDSALLEVIGSVKGEPWTAKYVMSAYRQGLLRSYDEAHPEMRSAPMDVYLGSRAQFLRDAFAQPERLSKAQLLSTRAFENMRGLGEAAKTSLNRMLADGISRGDGPAAIARQMRKEIEGLSSNRALTIARTEVIHAHAEGQLDGYEELGIEEVGAELEWSTAGDAVVCSRCNSMNGQIFTVEEARGLIPYHPNCRCAWIPAERILTE